jgi:hypothetical protein
MDFAQIPLGWEVEHGFRFIRSVDVFDTGKELEILIDLTPVDLTIFLLPRFLIDGPRLGACIPIAVVDMERNAKFSVVPWWSSCHVAPPLFIVVIIL